MRCNCSRGCQNEVFESGLCTRCKEARCRSKTLIKESVVIRKCDVCIEEFTPCGDETNCGCDDNWDEDYYEEDEPDEDDGDKREL